MTVTINLWWLVWGVGAYLLAGIVLWLPLSCWASTQLGNPGTPAAVWRWMRRSRRNWGLPQLVWRILWQVLIWPAALREVAR